MIKEIILKNSEDMLVMFPDVNFLPDKECLDENGIVISGYYKGVPVNVCEDKFKVADATPISEEELEKIGFSFVIPTRAYKKEETLFLKLEDDFFEGL